MVRPLRKSLSEKNLGIIGIPKKFYGITLDDFKTYGDKEFEAIKEYVTSYINSIEDKFKKGSGLYFYGGNGTGKTTLACIIAKEAYRHRYTSMRVTFSQYVQKYTETWGAKNAAERELMEDELFNRYKGVEFLILEELGKEMDTKAVRPILEDLLRFREDSGLVTIYCSNLAPERLLDLYGKSIFSLIQGNAYPILLDGYDRRKERFQE